MTEYHVKESCNKCAGENELIKPSCEEGYAYETKTKCTKCGFDDYWAYGYFESSQEMESNCKKYYNPPIK